MSKSIRGTRKPPPVQTTSSLKLKFSSCERGLEILRRSDWFTLPLNLVISNDDCMNQPNPTIIPSQCFVWCTPSRLLRERRDELVEMLPAVKAGLWVLGVTVKVT